MQDSKTLDAVLRLPVVETVSGLKRAAIYRAISKGQFPKQVRLGTRAVGWKASEIQAWVSSRQPA